MRNLREIGSALVVAVISISLIVGALSISLVEFSPEATITPTNIIPPSPIPVTATSTPLPTDTPTLSLESPTPSITSTNVNTATPPLSCPPPSGWVTQINIQAGDSLEVLAALYRISKEQLKQANCLVSDILVPGSKLYVPPVGANTSAACNKGASGWVNNYTVKPGDTIYSIATRHYTTSNLLKSVNCKTSDLIVSGEVLWVPNVPTRTPLPSPLPGVTVTLQATEPLTETVLPFTLTAYPPTNTSLPPISTMILTGTPSATSNP